MKKVLVSVTTLKGTDWARQIEDLKKLNLSEFAVFVSALPKEIRPRLYEKLEKTTPDAIIPFVHARSDMPLAEYKYWQERWGTQKFNLHPRRGFPWQYDLSSLKDCLYIENSGEGDDLLSDEDLIGAAGICLDTAHLENTRLLHPEGYDAVVAILKKYPIGCNHLSAIANKRHDSSGVERYDAHTMTNLSEYNYLKQFSSEYFGEFMAIELTNSIADQLKAKEYIDSIIAL